MFFLIRDATDGIMTDGEADVEKEGNAEVPTNEVVFVVERD